MKPKYSFCLLLLLLFIGGGTSRVSAQDWAIKTNIVYDATATVNLGVEVGLAPKWTLDVSGNFNAWSKNEATKWKHWFAQPEFRYWFCEAFQGHFIGINGNFTQFNMGSVSVPLQRVFINLAPENAPVTDLSVSRAEGWAVGAGITYGYAFPIARRWNIEFTAGFGWWYTTYSQYESRKCGLFQETVQIHALGPTSLGISFIYMIK